MRTFGFVKYINKIVTENVIYCNNLNFFIRVQSNNKTNLTLLIKRSNLMQQCADIYSLQVTLHVSGVTASIIRSTKNCVCYHWYRSWYWYRYFLPPWSDQDSYFGVEEFNFLVDVILVSCS